MPESTGTAHRSLAPALLFRLVLSLAVVVAYSWYITRQIGGLRRLQTEMTDRNRRESLHLVRIQNDLNQLGLSMRDMLDSGGEPYPLFAWSAQSIGSARIWTTRSSSRRAWRSPNARRAGTVPHPIRCPVLGRGGPYFRAGPDTVD